MKIKLTHFLKNWMYLSLIISSTSYAGVTTYADAIQDAFVNESLGQLVSDIDVALEGITNTSIRELTFNRTVAAKYPVYARHAIQKGILNFIQNNTKNILNEIAGKDKYYMEYLENSGFEILSKNTKLKQSVEHILNKDILTEKDIDELFTILEKNGAKIRFNTLRDLTQLIEFNSGKFKKYQSQLADMGMEVQHLADALSAANSNLVKSGFEKGRSVIKRIIKAFTEIDADVAAKKFILFAT